MTNDPKSIDPREPSGDTRMILALNLDAEERRIWDTCAWHFMTMKGLFVPITSDLAYGLSAGTACALIEARRKVFAAPQPETVGTVEYPICAHCLGKELSFKCPNCGQPVPWEDHHLDPCAWICTKPAPCPTPEAGAVSEIKRFDFDDTPAEWPTGEYVLYADHRKALVEELMLVVVSPDPVDTILYLKRRIDTLNKELND